jgi:glucose-1-phosphate cytidylyltransferase
MIEDFKQQEDQVASFMAYQPTQSFHVVSLSDNNQVKNISHIGASGLWINAGYFVIRNEIFNYLNEGEELVNEPFQRLIKENRLHGYRFNGFWASMDTFKDKQTLDDQYAKGNAPWEVWKK